MFPAAEIRSHSIVEASSEDKRALLVSHVQLSECWHKRYYTDETYLTGPRGSLVGGPGLMARAIWGGSVFSRKSLIQPLLFYLVRPEYKGEGRGLC